MKQNLIVTSEDILLLHKRISRSIKQHRIKRRISQLEMAALMGYTSDTFYNLAENNKNNKKFNIEHIYIISEILEINICELIINNEII